MFPPPPVRLATITDARLLAVAGLETQLDHFYAGILKFGRDECECGLIYRAENCRLRFDSKERPQPRDDYRLLGVIVPSLAEIIRRLSDEGLAYTRQLGLLAGQESLILNDPCGNLLEITESRLID